MPTRFHKPHAVAVAENGVSTLGAGLIKSSLQRGEQGPDNGCSTNSVITGSDSSDLVEPIAIIGLATKFPGDAADTERFWEMLIERRSALSKVPEKRYSADAFEGPTQGHFIQEDLGAFDAAFFTVSPAEAESMDPQQRWLLETSYQAFENAGISLDQARGSQTSVHVGCFTHDFEKMMLADADLPGRHKVLGSSTSILANRISWFYDLHGPSVVVDTACSSSLVALHQACQTLRNGDADMGIVAGVNIIFDPAGTLNLNNLGFLSPDSKCYSFDHRANGYSRGEGVGVVIIKPLVKALEDGNCIRAVIRATGSNQDGRTPGITQPSGSAQEELIRSTYKQAGLDMAATRYFEAHGTGTAVGDPTEAKAIAEAFRGSLRDPLYIGAVKSNIGHLEGASGIAGLIKTVLVLERGMIPANIWFERVNPKIDAQTWKLVFPTETIAWPSPGLRRASVNSFGFGGTNAHAVLDDAYHFLSSRGLSGKHSTKFEQSTSPDRHLDYNGSRSVQRGTGNVVQLLTLSAFDEAGIERLTSTLLKSYMRRRRDNRAQSLEDVAFTINERRNKLAWRCFALATAEKPLHELTWSLPVRATKENDLCFVFTGQGAQWRHMGQGLLRFKVFENAIEDAENFLGSLGCYWSIRAIYMEYFPKDAYADINKARFSQPLCTVLQVALVDLLMSWGIKPAVVVGHSSGEIAAAYCSGSISRETAWAVSYYRGLAVSQACGNQSSSSSMMAVQLSADRLAPYLSPWNYSCAESDRITIACYNSPCNVTVSGPIQGLDVLGSSLEQQGVLFRKLRVEVAYHSSHMTNAAQIYRQYLKSHWQTKVIGASDSGPLFISTVTGTEITSHELQTPDYWVSNLLNPVKFSSAMSRVLSSPVKSNRVENAVIKHLVELGPHSALRSPLRDICKGIGEDIERFYSSVLVRNQDGLITALDCIGKLYCSGYQVELAKINRELGRTKTPQMLTYLSPYPFNHAQNYWLESRLDQSFRFRKGGRHELLGTPVSDWNELEARWNNRLILKGMDFLSDHKVNGMDVYPAAGMLVMAIEAVRQLLPAKSAVTGYRFKDVTIQTALPLDHTSQGTETQLVLRPSRATAANPLSQWSGFAIYVFENKSWRECCTGAISVEYEESLWSPSGLNEREEKRASSITSLKEAESKCRIVVNKGKVYQALEQIGLEYGPTFQGLDSIRVDNHGSAVGVVNLQHWKSTSTSEKCNAHLIHPTALDAVLQLAFPALTGSGLEHIPTMVPTCITNLWISNDTNILTHGQQLNASAMSKLTGLREVRASVIAGDIPNNHVLLTLDASMTIIDTVRSMEFACHDPSRRFYRVDYHPDVALLDDAKQADQNGGHFSIPDTTVQDMNLEKEWLCLTTMATVIDGLPPSYVPPLPHLQRYVEWMRKQLVSAQQNPDRFKPARERSESKRDHFLDSISNFDAEGAILSKLTRNLSRIIHGEVDPLELLFSDDLLERFYREIICMNDQIKAFIAAAAHKSPGLRLLEVGAGTGSMTSVLLNALMGKHASTTSFKEYVYTDISSSFFLQAKEKFADPRIQFKTLDISSDPSSQGFGPGVFDIIAASEVLHATPDIEKTLRHCRTLLKSGGKLILHENMNPDSIRMGFIFGLLPGWWLSQEKSRQWSPLMSKSEWHGFLMRTGFSGADLLLNDVSSRPTDEPGAVLISTAMPTLPLKHPIIKVNSMVKVIYEQSSNSGHEILEQLQRQHAVLQNDAILTFVEKHDVPETDFTNAICIFLPDLDRPLLQNLGNEDLSLLKHICSEAKGMIWVCGQSGDPNACPSHALAKGLARTIEAENPDFSFVTITLETPYSIARTADHIWKIFLRNPRRHEEGYENEYVVRNNVLCIPRLVEAPDITAEVYPDPDVSHFVSRTWKDGTGRPLKLTVGAVGSLDTLAFEEYETNSSALRMNEVEVHVLAVGLNFKDVLTALGQVNDNYLGNELVGTVTGVGSSQTTDLKIGDTVVGVHTGTLATTVRCKAYQLHRLPAEIPFLTAAALPLVYCTAYYSLVTWARAQPGESILIHSGAGGVGQAAIQLSKAMGLTIFTTTSSDDKVRLLMEMYGIPKSHIFSSRTTDFAMGIKRLTQDVGVDIVLNSLSGEALRSSWEVLAPFGRFIELGKKDIHSSGTSFLGGLPMQPFDKNVMFASVDLPSLYKRQDRISGVLRAVVKLAAEGKIAPPRPLKVFKGSEIQQAFRLMQTGKHMGKLVIEFPSEDLVEVRKLRRSQVFDPRATYIIAGGLGGIARSICQWMVRKGARHIALLSRSGVQDLQAETFLDHLRLKGAQVEAPSCDVSDVIQLQAVLHSITSTMPPIKGCIQAAMVLRNVSFQKMSIEDWTAATKPKVDGSWNLHTLLPKGMDFFILLSSHSGLIGAHGQSNYAAGNVFQDVLAHHRTRLGEKAISIDLGTMSSIGYVANNSDVMAQALKQVMEDFSEQELLSLLEIYCDPERPAPPASDAVIVTPMPIPALLRAQGITEPFWMSKPIFRHLHQISTVGQAMPSETKPMRNWEAILREAKTMVDAENTVQEAIRNQLADLLAIGVDDVDASKPVHSYGVDSLVAVELRNWFARSIGADVAVLELLGNSTIAKLAANVAKKCRFVSV